jgi:hypothetical protein
MARCRNPALSRWQGWQLPELLRPAAASAEPPSSSTSPLLRAFCFLAHRQDPIKDGEVKFMASNNPRRSNRAVVAASTARSGSSPGPPDRDVIIAIKNSEVLKPLPSLEIHLR